jgi:hypothetical protein
MKEQSLKWWVVITRTWKSGRIETELSPVYGGELGRNTMYVPAYDEYYHYFKTKPQAERFAEAARRYSDEPKQEEIYA